MIKKLLHTARQAKSLLTNIQYYQQLQVITRIKQMNNILAISVIACEAISTGSKSLPSPIAIHVIQCIQELNLRPAIDLEIRINELRLIFAIFYQTTLSESIQPILLTYAKDLIMQGCRLGDIEPIIACNIEISGDINKINVSENIRQGLMIYAMNLIMQGCELHYIKEDIENKRVVLLEVLDNLNKSIYRNNVKLTENVKQVLIEIAVNSILAGRTMRAVQKYTSKRLTIF